MKKPFLTAALFLLTVSLASAGAQGLAPAPADNSKPANRSDKTDQPGQNDQQSAKKDKKNKKGSTKVKTKKPASEEEKKYDPTAGIWG